MTYEVVPEKFPKFERRAGTGFSTDWCLVMAQHVSFAKECVTCLRSECSHSLDVRVFIVSFLCSLAIFFFVEMVDMKEKAKVR
jgi:hypothetical protein